LIQCKEHLEKGKSIRELDLDKEEKVAIADLCLLTDKPVLYVANVVEPSMHTGNKFSDALKEAVKHEKGKVIIINKNCFLVNMILIIKISKLKLINSLCM